MNKQILLFIISVFLISSAVAETAYVSDELSINLRRGEGNSFKIRRALKSGEALEIISRNRESGYSKVVTKGGTEGYVLTRLLMDQPSARDRLETTISRNQTLHKKITQLESDISRLDEIEKQQSNRLDRLKMKRINYRKNIHP